MTELAAFVGHVFAAVIMGMVIGVERQFRQHTAGLRTNALVCTGAALFVSLSRLMQASDAAHVDPTRIASYVVSGIGFLGGGVILREGLNVRGMNTAATLWCSAAVGTLAGSGYIAEAAVGTGIVLLIHLSLRPVVRRIDARWKTTSEVDTLYRLRVVCPKEQEALIRAIFMRHINSQPNMTLQGLSTQESEREGNTAVVADIFSMVRNDKYLNDLVSRISIEPSITSVSWEQVS